MRRMLARLCVLTIVGATSAVVASVAPATADYGATEGHVGISTVFTTRPGSPPTMSCQVVLVDVTTGTITQLGPELESELCPVDYAARDDGRIYGVTLTGLTTQEPSPLVLVDPSTGEQTVIGRSVHVTDLGGLEFDAAGALWFYGRTTENDCAGVPCLYRVDPETAVFTFVGQLDGEASFVGGMTRSCVDPLSTNVIPASPLTGNAGVLSTIDTGTAQLGAIGPLGGTDFAGGLAFGADGLLWGVAGTALAPPRTYATVTVDPATGAATHVADLPISDDPEAFETMTGLTFGPLDCAVDPVELTPTFTG